MTIEPSKEAMESARLTFAKRIDADGITAIQQAWEDAVRAAHPAILADLKERLLQKSDLLAERIAKSSEHEVICLGRRGLWEDLEAVFNRAIEAKK